VFVISWVWDVKHVFQSWMMRKFRWDYFKLTWINIFYLTFGKGGREGGREVGGGEGFSLIWEQIEVQREKIFNLWEFFFEKGD